MTPFSFHRPTELSEAVQLLSSDAASTKLMAGGQTLLLGLKERQLRPTRVLSLESLNELTGVRTLSDGRLDIGATTTYATLARSKFSGWQREISAVAGNLADRSVRALGTIGGAICQAEPRYDMPTLMTTAGAELRLVSCAGERLLRAAEFFNLQGGANLTNQEILTRIIVPAPDAFDGLAFEKFRFRVFDAAITSVCCALKLGPTGAIATARCVVGAIAKAPLSSVSAMAGLVGRRTADLRAQDIGIAVRDELASTGQTHSLRQRYQSELVVSLTAKAFARAAAQTTSA